MSQPRSRALTSAELDRFGAELDALRARTVATLGQRDADYIRRIYKAVRYTGVAGRALLFARLRIGRTSDRIARVMKAMSSASTVSLGW